MTDLRPVLSVDFDGVIHSYTSGWRGVSVLPDPPVPGAMAFLREAVKVFDVQVFSCRSRSTIGVGAMQDYVEHWARLELGEDAWTTNISYPTTKPPAHVSLDDRGWQFTGVWPDLQELLAFKPWNKREALLP